MNKFFVNGSALTPSSNKLKGVVSRKDVALTAIATVALSGSPAFADGTQSVGTLSTGWAQQLTNISKVVLDVCTVGGVIVAGSGLLELKRSQDPNNQGRDNPKSAGTKILSGGGLAAIAAVVNLGIGTIFNGGGGGGSVSQGTVVMGAS